MNWSTDVSSGAWLVERIRGFAVNVGSIVPSGFEAYARVFHPIERGPVRRWSELAAANGRIAHPEMQFHMIAHPPGETADGYDLYDGVEVGTLPSPELTVLSTLLADHTPPSTTCWFAVWEGFGQINGASSAYVVFADGSTETAPPPEPLAPAEVIDGPRLELPNRAYLLASGGLGEVVGLADELSQSPNLWWPEDRSWCVATEIDFGWTYVAGSQGLIDTVVACDDLEALPARLTDGVTFASDTVNGALG